MRMVDQLVHLSSEYLESGISQHARASPVQKRTAAIGIDSVDALIGRFEQGFEGDKIGGCVRHKEGYATVNLYFPKLLKPFLFQLV